MDLVELIRKRRSIRAFTPRVPSKELILECLEAAAWAPNPTSQQPWRFIVLTGGALALACRVIKEHFSDAAAAMPAEPPVPVTEASAAMLLQRKKENFGAMMAHLKAGGFDMQAAAEGNFTFHGAPVGIIVCSYPCKDQNYLKSCVAAMENFLLAAAARGLGTCWMNAVSICRDAIRPELALSDELIPVDGIAVGYPDPGSPMNSLPRGRLPIEQVTDWRE